MWCGQTALKVTEDDQPTMFIDGAVIDCYDNRGRLSDGSHAGDPSDPVILRLEMKGSDALKKSRGQGRDGFLYFKASHIKPVG